MQGDSNIAAVPFGTPKLSKSPLVNLCAFCEYVLLLLSSLDLKLEGEIYYALLALVCCEHFCLLALEICPDFEVS